MERHNTETPTVVKSSEDICSQQQQNYNAIDVAKFICSILVVMIHIAPFGFQNDTSIFYYMNFGLQQALCRIAVPLFFIFSGFLLYRKTPLDNFSTRPTKKYIKHISFLYLIWSIIYFPLSLLDIIYNPNGVSAGVTLYIRDSIFKGSYGHLWYLTSLMFAVVLISFLLYRKWTPKKIFYTSLIFYIFGLLGDGYYGIISPLMSIPFIGKILSLYFKIFDTTRNGLFFAFFFVSVGMFFSNTTITLPKKKALLLFLASLVVLCVESFTLLKFNIARDHNVLLFTIPSAMFCFIYLKSLNLRDGKIYKYLRLLCSLIFYGHLWVNFCVSRWIYSFDGIGSTCVPFMVTLILTIIIALVVIKISTIKGFRWLKKLY